MSHQNAQNGAEWPVSTRRPSSADVYLLFHGLFGFAHNATSKVCEVGVHSKAPDHVFKILVYEHAPGDGEPRLIYSYEPDSPFEVPGGLIEVDVQSPSNAGVGYYQPRSAGPLDDSDWRRVPDLEGPALHNQPVARKANSYRPIIRINHAQFSVIPTPYEFVRFVADGSEPELNLGKIAWWVVGAISHDQGGYVMLKIGSAGLKLSAEHGRRYFVAFGNACLPDDCNHDPNSPIKERRNDFYLYYKTLDLPPGAKEYELKLRPGQPKIGNNHSMVFDGFNLDLLERIRSSKDSPCGSLGFGKSDGV
ncbi:MAG: hypothetical protein M3410_08205 [Acidobacteriota bacterium]|nr:hypothetical protein [Acidobacteriota bacterium]